MEFSTINHPFGDLPFMETTTEENQVCFADMYETWSPCPSRSVLPKQGPHGRVCYNIWTQHNYMLKPASSLRFVLKKTIKSNGSSAKHILISAFPRQLSRFAECQHV